MECFRFVTVTGLGNNVLNLFQSQFVVRIKQRRRSYFVKNFAQASSLLRSYLHSTCLLQLFFFAAARKRLMNTESQGRFSRLMRKIGWFSIAVFWIWKHCITFWIYCIRKVQNGIATFVKYDKKWFTMVKSCLQNGLKLFRIGRNCNIQFLAASPLLHHFMSQVFSVISSLHFIIFSSISPLLYPFSFMAKRFIAGSFLNNMILIINKLHRLFWHLSSLYVYEFSMQQYPLRSNLTIKEILGQLNAH